MENNFDVNKEFIQHLQKENEELKSKVKKLEDKLAMEKLMKNIDKIPKVPITPHPIEPYPYTPPSPWYYEPWWEKGPTCNSVICEVK